MDKLYLYIIFFLFMNSSFPQVPILYYDFESNSNRSIFENAVEQSINPGSGPIARSGLSAIGGGSSENGLGKALKGSGWENVTSDPGIKAKEYYQFSVNTSGFKGICIKFRDYAPDGTSPKYVGCNFSSDGSAFKSAGPNATGAPSTSWNEASIELNNYPEVNNNPNLVIRIYAYAGTGFLTIDNLMVTAEEIISGTGEIQLLNETDFYNSYYSGGTGSQAYYWKKNLVINGPGTTVKLISPVNFSKNFTLNAGSILQCGTYPVWGGCSFTLNNGAAIYIGDASGITQGTDSIGNICVKGTRTFSPGSAYYYTGLLAQVTGNGLPPSVNILGINNSSGVALSNNVFIVDTMKLIAGNLILADKDLIINDTAVIAGGSSGTYVVTNNSGGIIFNKMTQSKDIIFPVGTLNSYNPAIINYTGVPDTFKVKVKDTYDIVPTNPDKVVQRQWLITENTEGGSTARIKFGWMHGHEAPGFNINSVVLIGRWNGATWNQNSVVISGSGTQEDQYFATSDGITAFSYFGIGNDGALPVELIYFGCKVNGRGIKLNWETATETNSNNFEIERKIINTNFWEKVGTIKANFVSNSYKNYYFNDADLEPGKYFYRIRMNDNDGSFQYSSIVEADINVPGQFAMYQNYPNPFNPSTIISYELPEDALVVLEVYNIKGEKVSTLVNEYKKAGFYEVKFEPAGGKLSSGIYFYRMNFVNILNGRKVSLNKKMVYLK